MIRSLDRVFQSSVGHMPLGRLLSSVFALLLLATVAFTGYLIINSSGKIVDSIILQLATNTGHDVANEVERFLETPETINQNTLQAVRAARVDPEDIASLSRFLWDSAHRNLENLVSSIYFASDNGSFLSIAVADSHHPDEEQMFSASGPLTNGIYTDFKARQDGSLGDTFELHGTFDPRVRPWYIKALESPGQAVWSEIYSDFDTRQATLTRSISISDDTGVIVGVAAVDLFLEHVQEFIETLTLSDNSEVFIVDDDRLLIAAIAPAVGTNELSRNIPVEQSPFKYTKAAVGHLSTQPGFTGRIRKTLSLDTTLEGTTGLLYARPLGENNGVNWTLGVFLPKGDYLGTLTNQIKTVLPIIALSVLIAIGSVVGFLALVVRPLKRLTANAGLIATGRFDVPIEINSENEVGDLAKAIDHMQVELKETLENLLLRDRAISEVDIGIFICDATRENCPVLYINKAVEKISGYPAGEIIGTPPNLLLGDVSQPLTGDMHNTLLNHKPVQTVAKNRRKDGTDYFCEATISPVRDGSGEITHYIGILKDITKRLKTESHLREAQKSDAIGQLSSGIAHNFNNLLSIILGHLESLDDLSLDATNRQHIVEAQKAVDLGARLTHRLLTFSRRGLLDPISVDLNTQINGALSILESTIGESISIIPELDSEIWSVFIDPSEIESAVVNLVINARDAMPSGGVIHITTRNITIDADSAPDKSLSYGDYVQLVVSDSGMGMTEEIRSRIFEPFFTTKAHEKGTGLGLASIQGFTTQSGGAVTVASELGCGSTFTLYIPRYFAPVECDDNATTESTTVALTTEKQILVVEDNPQILELTVARLVSMGFSVLPANCGSSALTTLESGADIALVFCDLVMPGDVGARDVVQWVQRNRPNCKILLTTGFSELELNDSSENWNQWPVLKKPYRMQTLQEAISSVLETSC